MPDDLRWSWCNNNRNKVHNTCNVLESSRNHLPCPRSLEKLSSMKMVPGAKKVGDRCSRGSLPSGFRLTTSLHFSPAWEVQQVRLLWISVPHLFLPSPAHSPVHVKFWCFQCFSWTSTFKEYAKSCVPSFECCLYNFGPFELIVSFQCGQSRERNVSVPYYTFKQSYQ